jgi:hypothetical protein
MVKKEYHGRLLRWIAWMSFLGFILFYLFAALRYPGGSDFDKNSKNFSFVENYWCDLLSDYSKNGKYNVAQPFAYIAMAFMNLGLSTSWVFIGHSRSIPRNPDLVLEITGLASTIFLNFLNTSMHDQFISLSIGLGCFSMLRVLLTGHKKNSITQTTGYLSVVLILLNCVMYVFIIGLTFLPIIQKITFIFVMSWFMLNLRFTKS